MDVYTALYITADEKHMMDIVNRRVSLTVKKYFVYLQVKKI